MASAPQLPHDYDRATLIIGGAVSAVDRTMNVKNDWL